jgi:predicted site-specific integrase-resolvase
MLIENVEPEKWYAVREVAAITGWEVDTVRRWIYDGYLQAFQKPGRSSRRKRIYRAMRVQGAELIRFIKDHLTPRK